MANRNLLHINHLPDFSNFLIENGWNLEQSKGDYEVIRARKGKSFMPVYQKHDAVHLSVADKFSGVIISFLENSKGCLKMTNKQRLATIKSDNIIEAIKGLSGEGSYSTVDLKAVINDVEWLIEQVERSENLIESLEDKNRQLAETTADHEKTNDKSQELKNEIQTILDSPLTDWIELHKAIQDVVNKF